MNRFVLGIMCAWLIGLVGALLTLSTTGADEKALQPANLSQKVAGKSLRAGNWTNASRVQVSFDIQGSGSKLTPQVELRPTAQPLRGQPTGSGQPATVGERRTAPMSITMTGLKSGSYAWQARIVDDAGTAGLWARFAPTGSVAFGIDMVRPSSLRITSPSHPRAGGWYKDRIATFRWTATDDLSGVAGYSARLDQQPSGRPGTASGITQLTSPSLKDGRWVLHVWAIDRAGNWSAEATYPFNIDGTPPGIDFLGSTDSPFNPYAGQHTWRFSTNERATVTVDIRRSSQPGPVLVRSLGTLAAGAHTFVWDGKTSSGTLSPADWHWFHVTAIDAAGNSSNRAFGGTWVRPDPRKHIVISLSQQKLFAYVGDRMVWSSVASTGNQTLTPTPTGHYTIYAKYSPLQFISPWPPGHPYYYEPVWTSYGMAFLSGGYFIHDAPWRSIFGPASQAGEQPGTNYGGSHGCVNLPLSAAQFLYNWAPIGTPVDVLR